MLLTLKGRRVSFHIFVITEDILRHILVSFLAKHSPYGTANVQCVLILVLVVIFFSLTSFWRWRRVGETG